MVQNKQRTRVRLIEHLIRLSVKLRELDNYDCLSRSSRGFRYNTDLS